MDKHILHVIVKEMHYTEWSVAYHLYKGYAQAHSDELIVMKLVLLPVTENI